MLPAMLQNIAEVLSDQNELQDAVNRLKKIRCPDYLAVGSRGELASSKAAAFVRCR